MSARWQILIRIISAAARRSGAASTSEIPYGSTTVNGSTITAPYFLINSVNLSWKGPGSLLVVAMTLLSHNSDTDVRCAVAGDNLAVMFPTQLNNGNVIIPANTSVVGGIATCTGMAAPVPLPTLLNIPVTLTVIGVALDANGLPVATVDAKTELVVQ